jgi:hypothetical protein
VEASNSCARILIFVSFLLLSFVKFFSLSIFYFFDLAFCCLFSFFNLFFYHNLFSPSFSLLFVFLTYVISSLAYLNLLQNKRLGCSCGGQNDISIGIKGKIQSERENTIFEGY